MYNVTVVSHFSGAHRLRCLQGRCEHLHGHNWKIEVTVASTGLRRDGIVIDFGVLKQHVEKVLKTLDHSYLNDHPYFSKREPSSENIARYIYDRIKKELRGRAVKIEGVTAWESETAFASYLGRSS